MFLFFISEKCIFTLPTSELNFKHCFYNRCYRLLINITYICWPAALSAHRLTIISPSSLSVSLKASHLHQFLSISSPAGPLEHSLSPSSRSSYPLVIFFDPHFSLTVSCTPLHSQETRTSSCSSFNSSWSPGCLPLILWQISTPAGQIHTDSVSHRSCICQLCGSFNVIFVVQCIFLFHENVCSLHLPLGI